MKKLVLAVFVIGIALGAPDTRADCVYGARSETSFRILDEHTIYLTGGFSGSILIKSFHFFQPASGVAVLKDSFCDYDSAVLYVDGEPIDVQQVKHIQ